MEYSPEPTELGLPVDLAKMSDIEAKRMNNLSELFGVYEVLLLLLDRFEEELDFAFNEVSYLWWFEGFLLLTKNFKFKSFIIYQLWS